MSMPKSSGCLEAAVLIILLLVALLVALSIADNAIGVRFILKAEAQGPSGNCKGCKYNYQGSGWQSLGGTPGNSSGFPPFNWWNCPACGSTKVTAAPNMVPGGVHPWTGRGATAWGSTGSPWRSAPAPRAWRAGSPSGGGYHLRPLEERWSRWN